MTWTKGTQILCKIGFTIQAEGKRFRVLLCVDILWKVDMYELIAWDRVGCNDPSEQPVTSIVTDLLAFRAHIANTVA